MNANRVFGNNNSYANASGLSSSTYVSINSAFTKPWILDSGATDHITSDSTLFTKTESCPMPIVNLPTRSTVPITSTGTVPFNSDITLDKDLATGKIIGSGKQRGGLYYMSPLQSTPISNQPVAPRSHHCRYRSWLASRSDPKEPGCLLLPIPTNFSRWNRRYWPEIEEIRAVSGQILTAFPSRRSLSFLHQNGRMRFRPVFKLNFQPLPLIIWGMSKNKSDSKLGVLPRVGVLARDSKIFQRCDIALDTHALPARVAAHGHCS
ncbi:unnamed protein product [Prunus armeniaca]